MATSLYAGFKRGIVNFPGITSASKEVARQLLSKDAAEHHCYFRSAGLHNHVSHQLSPFKCFCRLILLLTEQSSAY